MEADAWEGFSVEEMEDDVDIMEFIQSKTGVLDAFKTEYLEQQKSIDSITAANAGRDREMDILRNQYNSVLEQKNFVARNVDELVGQQEVLKEKIDAICASQEHYTEKESQQQNEIQLYSVYFVDLKEQLAVGVDWSPEQMEQRDTLQKERDFIYSKYENKKNLLTSLRSEITRNYESIQELETKGTKQEEQITEFEAKNVSIKKETESLNSKKGESEQKVYDLRASALDKEKNLIERKRNAGIEERALRELDMSIANSKIRMEKYIAEYESLYRRLTDMTSELERQVSSNKKSDLEVEATNKELEQRQRDTVKLIKSLAKVNQLKKLCLENCAKIDEEKHNFERKIDDLNNRIRDKREVESRMVRKETESLDKQVGQQKAEIELLRYKGTNKEKNTRSLADLIQLNKNGKINLSVELKVLQDEAMHQKIQIENIAIEKEKLEHDSEVANQQYYTTLEELKLQELQISELNAKIIQDQTKFKMKQNLFESVRADRNLYSKQLVDAQDEISSLKKDFRSMNHTIEQMKEEIVVKDHAIVKEHFCHHSVEKEREVLRNERTKIKKQLHSSETIIENQRVEILKLQRIIEEAEKESSRQKQELAAVLSERNLITGQLVKRNFELNEMYEKIKNQRSHLRIGERIYDQYMQHYKDCQKALIEVSQEHNDTVHALSKVEQHKYKVVQLQKEILRTRTRTRALQDELEVRMNVHRWRKLESSDPKRFEKITQIQELQKQIIAFSDKVVQHDLLIQEKEKIYVELKNVLSRQPGPEVEENILLYQQTHKDKTKQLAAMNQELSMYMEQVATFKEEIISIDGDMTKLTKRWMKQRKAKDASLKM